MATIADLRRHVPATRSELTIDIAAAFCEIQGMQSEELEGEEECVGDDWITPEPERPHLLCFVGVVREASDLDGPPEGGLPADFITARDLLATEGESAMARAVALVSKYFDCEFDASNVDLDLGEFVGLARDEYRATRVELLRIDFFDDERLPAATGVAWFELAAQFDRTIPELEAWEESNSYLDHGLRFLWKLDGGDAQRYELSDTRELRREYLIESEELEALATDEDAEDDEGDVGNDTDDSSDATSSDGLEHDR